MIAVSEGMRADIMTAYPEISPERIRVIRNGIDTNEYRPDPDTEVLDRYGIDKNRPYVTLRRPDHQAEGPARAAAGRLGAHR